MQRRRREPRSESAREKNRVEVGGWSEGVGMAVLCVMSRRGLGKMGSI